MKLLLDTCAFLWVVTGSAELSPRARDAFQSPANEVYLSPVSAWEIAVKHALGRLPLTDPPDQLVPAQRRAHRIDELPLTEDAVLYLPKLPDWHKDPFDRMLVCQALASGLTLLTPDPELARYPVRTLW